MYSRKVVGQALDNFEARNGWRPISHTIGQIEEFDAYVKKITKAEQNSRRAYYEITETLTASAAKELRRFIQNEQLLCSFDSMYFENTYAYLCDEKGDIFKFRNRKAQEVFDQIIAQLEELQFSIELLILKARQQGITSKTALKFLHRMLFIGHTQAVMASVQADKSELIGRILNICYERCPWWLAPGRTTERAGKMMEWDNGSILSIQSGMQPTGIAQGWTPTCIHVSEFGDIPNPKKVIEEGLLRATHSSRKLFMVFEGTGNGNTGYFADKWRSSKEGWPTKTSRLMPVFIPWPLAPELYPEDDWIRKFPVPESWIAGEAARKHIRRCELYIRSTDYLASVCGSNWTMPREQQWFWEFNYLEAVKSHTTKKWFSQMPADDYEALTGNNDSVFDPEVIEIREQQRQPEYTAYAIAGDSIDDGFEPGESAIDYSRERIPIQWTSHRGQHYEWTMIPLLPIDEDRELDTFGKVLVFQEPKQGCDYSIGIDTADGLGKEDEDRSVLNVTLSAKGNYPDVQAAELVSNRINSPQMVGFAACLAAWYHPACRDPRGVKFCIEQRARPGDDCQLQLKLMGFSFQHVMTRYDSKVVKENAGLKHGYYESPWSRTFMLTRFIESITNGWYKVNSKWLLQELKDLERKISATTGKSRLEHQSGRHDDRVFAAALAYITRHAFDVLAERSQKTYAVRVALPDVDYNYPEQGFEVGYF